jgi:hypothetical protein
MWTKRNWGPTQVGSGKFFSPYPSGPLRRQERLLSVGTDGGGYIIYYVPIKMISLSTAPPMPPPLVVQSLPSLLFFPAVAGRPTWPKNSSLSRCRLGKKKPCSDRRSHRISLAPFPTIMPKEGKERSGKRARSDPDGAGDAQTKKSKSKGAADTGGEREPKAVSSAGAKDLSSADPPGGNSSGDGRTCGQNLQ